MAPHNTNMVDCVGASYCGQSWIIALDYVIWCDYSEFKTSY